MLPDTLPTPTQILGACPHDIAARLQATAQRNPEAIQPYSYAGTMGRVQSESMAQRFFHQLGASLLDRTICAAAGCEGLTHTLGGKGGPRVGQVLSQ